MMAAFLVMSLLLVLLGIISIFYTNRMQKNTRRILEENVSGLKAAEELEIALMDMKGLTANYLIDGKQSWLDIFAQKKATFLFWFNQAEERSDTAEEIRIIHTIDSLFVDYLFFQQKVIEQIGQGDRTRAYETLTQEMLATFNLIYNVCEELLAFNEKQMLSTSDMIDRDNTTVNYLVFGMGFTGIICGLGLSLLLSWQITHPIYNLVLRIKGATKEDVIQKVDIDNLTELEHLDKYVRTLIEKVSEINKDLEQSQMMLLRSEKLAALGKMTAGLAHEIRNPLTAIKMLMFSLKDELIASSHLSRDIDVVIFEIGRIEKFLQDFLDFARPPNPNLGRHRIGTIIEETMLLLAPQIKKAGIQLEIPEQNKNPLVHVDNEQLKQVLMNVMLNAIQAIPSDGKLQITTNIQRDVNEQTAHLIIKIHDNGPGIPNDLINQIFDPFITGREDGIGLGLSIANQIIHNHGGWIKAENNQEGGATFIINLPIGEDVA